MVAITKPIATRLEGEERLLMKLYDAWEVGKEQEWMSTKAIAEKFGEKEGTVYNAAIVYLDLGIAHREITWPDYQKQNVHWTLLMPRKEAWQALQDWHEQVRRSPTYKQYPKHVPKKREPKKDNGVGLSIDLDHVAVADKPASEGQELVAVAGPEASSPFSSLKALRKDESRAQVEAARQYANKGAFLEQKIEELRTEGFEVADGALTLKRDERLEAVALAVPYVDALERENERLLQHANTGRTAMRELEDLKNNYARLKRAHERLIADRVGTPVASGA